MEGFSLQASFKTPGDTLINVRGHSTEEFDLMLSHVVEKIEDIKAAETAIKPPPISGQGLIEQGLGGVVIGEIVESPPWPPVGAGSWQPPPQQGYQAGPPVQQGFQSSLCGRCGKASACKTCNSPCNPVPRSVKNGEYYIHDCLAAPQGDRTHKGPWCNQA